MSYKLFVILALKRSERAVADLEEKRRAAEEEAAAIVKAKEEAEARRLEVEELAKKNELEKEQMVCRLKEYFLCLSLKAPMLLFLNIFRK